MRKRGKKNPPAKPTPGAKREKTDFSFCVSRKKVWKKIYWVNETRAPDSIRKKEKKKNGKGWRTLYKRGWGQTGGTQKNKGRRCTKKGKKGPRKGEE